uniref:G-protein coupled receptors family 1 profile domain-containing protein n=1 Tax=Plectus sambesii TaxID=2011161 RepID=A0A914WIX6_9BILA
MCNGTTPFVYNLVSKEEYFSVNLFNTIVGSLGMCGNLFILFLFWKYKSLRENDSLRVFALLAFCDIFAAFGQVEFSLTHLVRQLTNACEATVLQCLLWSSAPTFGVQMGQIGLIAVAWDRLRVFKSAIVCTTRQHTRLYYAAPLLAVVYCLVTTGLLFPFVDLSGRPKTCNASDASPYFIAYWTMMSWVVSVTILAIYYRAYVLMRRILRSAILPDFARILILKQSEMTFTIQLILLVFVVLWVIPNALVVVAYVGVRLRIRTGALLYNLVLFLK